MKLKRFLTICLLLLATGILGFAVQQDDPLKKILTQLQKFNDDSPTEKVYLQLDKPYYAIGDLIYFKAYTTIGGKHQPSGLSKILYVDLINEKDSVKQSLRLPMAAGLSWGNFTLADTLQEGNYRIRAYTQWMRNFGEDYFFDKTISVGNAISNTVFTTVNYQFTTENGVQKINAVINYADLNNKPCADKAVSYRVQLDFRTVLKGKGTTDANGNLSISFSNPQPASLKSGQIITNITTDDKKTVVKTVPVKATSNDVDVQFFPESGDLVNGIRSKVAFKAVGADGLGIAIKGSVFNNTNNEVAKISTQHLGMGAFMLFPETGKTYTAKITFPDGSEKNYDLPKASDQGFVLSVGNTDPEFINLHVSVSNETFKLKQNTDIMVVGQSGGDVYYTAKSKLESQSFSARIPKSRFPSGIAQFTLFTQEGEPLNERIIFVNNPDQLKINVTSPETTSPRQNVKLDFTAQNKDKAPVVGSFSVAVTDETKVPVNEDKESTILSNLLLTSDIKGYIEQPNYYFAHTDEKAQADLDVLMLTQGYHRFAWRMLMGNSFPQLTYQPEKSMSIAGIVKTLGGKPVPKGKVTLFTTTKGAFLLDTVTDANGRFKFDNLIFPDSIRFVIQARGVNGKKNVEITLDNVPQQFVTKNKNAPDVSINLNRDLAAYLQNSKAQYDDLRKYGLVNRTIVLKEVTITEKKEPLKNSSNLNGPGNADQIIKGDLFEQMGCATIDQCLQGRLLGVIFRNGIPYSTRSFNTPMQIIVDGIYMEPDYLTTINPLDIASIEVLRTIGYTSIYGGRGSGGVLVINTKRGDDPSYSFQRYAPGIVTYNPKGFSRGKEFYSPKYDDPKTNKAVADLRTTIYWNPNLITDKDGKATFSFFNADSKGTYRVVIEGIDDAGNLGRQVYHYKVE
ncbi:TonB-dependent receptor plug domain-containing protein [Mucilaginibacter arboris]|uniref:TonB-dependent receptor plug domain-containing protein n=1 Tax=Mucilaginibacter arboris TaxID=2682090 RepID=A0A7K1SV68_9SPHI|nr:TonB-dependent receptor plug domain-containing protein [Mucilaginibacter arboris]MVN21215.1 TonB-dependent receptor plug domain-containing protein [Mucilaginibacter arboris]